MREPTPLELAAGMVIGWTAPAGDLPDLPPDLSPLAALQAAALPALEAGRCHVAFSGGRDSSAILAAVVDAARRHGLDLPIPLTMRFRDAPLADETEWQETVIRALGLSDWVRLDVDADIEILGPVAQQLLREGGMYWPANLQSYQPMMAAAAGGSLVTGIDGDGLLDSWRWGEWRQRIAHPRKWRPGDPARAALALGPAGVRRRWLAHREPLVALDWLRPDARREVATRLAALNGAEPRSWSRRLAWYRGADHLAVLDDGLERLAAPAGCRLVHPLRDEAFLAALARAGGGRGYADRTAALAAIFGDLLPQRTVRRATKANFTEVFWGPRTRAYVEAWDGRGVADAIVDLDALRATWGRPSPDFRSASLVQIAWLAGAGPDPFEYGPGQKRDRGRDGLV